MACYMALARTYGGTFSSHNCIDQSQWMMFLNRVLHEVSKNVDKEDAVDGMRMAAVHIRVHSRNKGQQTMTLGFGLMVP